MQSNFGVFCSWLSQERLLVGQVPPVECFRPGQVSNRDCQLFPEEGAPGYRLSQEEADPGSQLSPEEVGPGYRLSRGTQSSPWDLQGQGTSQDNCQLFPTSLQFPTSLHCPRQRLRLQRVVGTTVHLKLQGGDQMLSRPKLKKLVPGLTNRRKLEKVKRK